MKARFPEVAWARPVSLRNRIINGYWSVDLAIVHITATDLLRPFNHPASNGVINGPTRDRFDEHLLLDKIRPLDWIRPGRPLSGRSMVAARSGVEVGQHQKCFLL